MSKINKNVVKKQGSSKITPRATKEPSINYNECCGRFAFLNVCNRHCLLSEWRGGELDDLISCFKKVESSLWKNILKDDGLNYEKHHHIAFPLPSNFPPDAALDSIRVTQKMRLYGYRVDNVFYIIWFDREHSVCPAGKQKRYSI
jgi:hypothetical protein